MKRYSAAEVSLLLPDWEYSNEGIEREFKFQNFSEAFAFMTRVAMLAECADHHPDWKNSYNKVHIRLTNHAEQALTEKDLLLAGKIDLLLMGK
ncbi:MAG: 4a-hydroxytetrahydrobiopterin dehydratase [Chitinophagaceae bacterium]|uniref:Putative pterin-4-alpha-carbinolamine dehydratase n=1 Tax=Rurimicrobium arvi TaxID=2049916 RepID=A0ABP8MV33_9BACT